MNKFRTSFARHRSLSHCCSPTAASPDHVRQYLLRRRLASQDKNGRTIHYKPNTTARFWSEHTSLRLQRQPRLPWFALKQQLFVTNTLLNFVGYHVPKEIDTRKLTTFEPVSDGLSTCLPGKDAPSVNIFNDEYEEQQRCYVNFDASSKNVASDKMSPPLFYTLDGGWPFFGKPWYVGTPQGKHFFLSVCRRS